MKDSFGARLKFFRSKAGLSQQQLAEKVGLSRKMISDYEVKLDMIPRDSNLYKIADALEIDSSNLIPKTRNNGYETPEGDFAIKYNLNEFPKSIVDFLKLEAKKNNRTVQEEFNFFMRDVVHKFLNSSEEERKLKYYDLEKTKLEDDEESFNSYLEKNKND